MRPELLEAERRTLAMLSAWSRRAPTAEERWQHARWLWDWQRRWVPPYAQLCRERPEPTQLAEIPRVPVTLLRELRFCAADEPQAVFLTSGTTGAQSGQHAMVSTRAYEEGLRRGARLLAPSLSWDKVLALTPSPQHHPQSSLAHMIETLGQRICWGLDASLEIDEAAVEAALADRKEPVTVAATAFALAALLDRGFRCRLPPGSALMVTGGFKGRVRERPELELRAAAREQLGEEISWVGEYGMTELSSPLWDPDGRGYCWAPWLEVFLLDPLSGEVTQEEGQIALVDFVNWGSVMAIETRDRGRMVEGRLQLLGRLEGADARGCSLAMEELLP